VTSRNQKLTKYLELFRGISPFSGHPPMDYFVDFLGTLIHSEFRLPSGADINQARGGFVETRVPSISDGEGFFEIVNWFLAANEAKDSFTMITLGACYGGQAVGAALALKAINPLPIKLVAVEPEPTNMDWIKRHFRDNGIDPDEHWLLQSVLGADNSPIFFPVGSPGSGAQNSFSTNELAARKNYVKYLTSSGNSKVALEKLLLENTTGIHKLLVEGTEFDSEIKLLSSITLEEVLGPFSRVDFLESDIQQSEIIVFPPARRVLKDKVRRIHIGTHGKDVHQSLSSMFEEDGWEILFDFEPNSSFETELGAFSTNDGILTVVNPDLAYEK
jgi:hypothetical protein